MNDTTAKKTTVLVIDDEVQIRDGQNTVELAERRKIDNSGIEYLERAFFHCEGEALERAHFEFVGVLPHSPKNLRKKGGDRLCFPIRGHAACH